MILELEFTHQIRSWQLIGPPPSALSQSHSPRITCIITIIMTLASRITVACLIQIDLESSIIAAHPLWCISILRTLTLANQPLEAGLCFDMRPATAANLEWPD